MRSFDLEPGPSAGLSFLESYQKYKLIMARGGIYRREPIWIEE